MTYEDDLKEIRETRIAFRQVGNKIIELMKKGDTTLEFLERAAKTKDNLEKEK